MRPLWRVAQNSSSKFKEFAVWSCVCSCVLAFSENLESFDSWIVCNGWHLGHQFWGALWNWCSGAASSFDRYISSLLEASVMERHSRRFDTMPKLCMQCRLKKRLFSQFRVSRPKNPFSFMADLVGTCCSVRVSMQPCNDAMFCSSRLCKVSMKVKDTGLDHGVRSLHLLWAEGFLGIPGISDSMALISELRLPRDALLSVRCGQKSRQAQPIWIWLNLLT